MRQPFDYIEQKFHQQLKQIIWGEPALLQRLIDLKHIAPDAFLSAGVIRNLIWSVLHQQDYSIEHGEIDVIFFDQNEKEQQMCGEIQRYLTQKFPENEWDVVNQAQVHHWYKTDDGLTIAPYISLNDALSCWPETATAIAVRILENAEIEVIAPFGLTDLFELKLRWNDRLVSRAVFLQRVKSKRFLERWAQLKIVL